MINLLPQFEKKKLMNEFRLRFGVAVLCALLMLQVLLFVLFTPSYLSMSITTTNLEADLTEKKTAVLPEGNDIQKGLNAIKGEIALLKPVVSNLSIPPSQLMVELFSPKPVGVGVSSFSYGRSGTVVSMQLNGIATTREDLLLYQRLLKENPHFSDARYAQSFITKKTDIDFSLTVTLK